MSVTVQRLEKTENVVFQECAALTRNSERRAWSSRLSVDKTARRVVFSWRFSRSKTTTCTIDTQQL